MAHRPGDTLRIAVLCGETVERWEREALEAMSSRADVEVAHLVVKATDEHDGRLEFVRDAWYRLRTYPLWSLVGIARLATADPEYRRPVSIDDVGGTENAERIYCAPEPADGLGNVLPDEVVDRVGSRVDVVVRLAFGILKGRILEEPTYGVLSYHIGDIREYRGVMGAGFWEFLDGEDEVGVTLQQLTETLDGGRIVALERVDIADAETWQETKRRMFATARSMLLTGVDSLSTPEFTPCEPERLGEFYHVPTGWAVVRYLWKNTAGRTRNAVGATVSSIRGAYGAPFSRTTK